jgi:hypothetical protein
MHKPRSKHVRYHVGVVDSVASACFGKLSSDHSCSSAAILPDAAALISASVMKLLLLPQIRPQFSLPLLQARFRALALLAP